MAAAQGASSLLPVSAASEHAHQPLYPEIDTLLNSPADAQTRAPRDASTDSRVKPFSKHGRTDTVSGQPSGPLAMYVASHGSRCFCLSTAVPQIAAFCAAVSRAMLPATPVPYAIPGSASGVRTRASDPRLKRLKMIINTDTLTHVFAGGAKDTNGTDSAMSVLLVLRRSYVGASARLPKECVGV